MLALVSPGWSPMHDSTRQGALTSQLHERAQFLLTGSTGTARTAKGKLQPAVFVSSAAERPPAQPGPSRFCQAVKTYQTRRFWSLLDSSSSETCMLQSYLSYYISVLVGGRTRIFLETLYSRTQQPQCGTRLSALNQASLSSAKAASQDGSARVDRH